MGCLGLVLVAMNQLRQPETIERLDRVFGVKQQPSNQPAPESDSSPTSNHAASLILGNSSNTPTREEFSESSTKIEDNTYFRSEETEAWFDAFERLASKSPEQLAADSLGEITYAQFLQQPEVYRHRVVTLRGTVVREEALAPPENRLGIEQYHRLWLAPHGGGEWPFVVYCRTLPAKFPRDKVLREPLTVHGEFFKIWSYQHDEGMGLAPAVLAQTINWQPTKSRPQVSQEALPVKQMIWAATGTGVFALLVVWMAVRRTKRRPRRFQLPETFQGEETSEGSEQ